MVTDIIDLQTSDFLHSIHYPPTLQFKKKYMKNNGRLLPIDHTSDKEFWHGFIDFYNQNLPENILGTIIEFGVLKGNSIRWIEKKYSNAEIIGIDILPTQDSWPQSDKISYYKLDQGDEADVIRFFETITNPELIIEDGSHIPSHQCRILRHGLNNLKPGGVYILEDIHTSHPAHSIYIKEYKSLKNIVKNIIRHKSLSRIIGERRRPKVTSLTLLFTFEQALKNGQDCLSEEQINLLSSGYEFSKNDVIHLFSMIDQIKLYRRAGFPSSCYSCGSKIYEYHKLQCVCGAKIYDQADSMSALIKKKESPIMDN